MLDIVPASRTVLLKLAGPRYQAPTRQRLQQAAATARGSSSTPADGRADVVIDVVYDGADLDEVARLTGLDPDQVIAAHTGTLWRVGFGGFAPGFAYLVGGDPNGCNVPRRAEPRTKVPAGAVGAGRRVQRRLPARIARRLAADRPHRRACCGTSTATRPRC